MDAIFLEDFFILYVILKMIGLVLLIMFLGATFLILLMSLSISLNLEEEVSIFNL